MTRAREAARLIGNNTFRLDSNNAVGFNSTTPDAMFDINHGLTVAGVSTFTGNVTMSGDLTVQGTTTTLDTTLQEVDLINVQANASVPGLGVTQSGSGAIISAYDGTSEVFTVADGGTVTITTAANAASASASADNLVIKDSGGCGLSILSGDGNSQNIYLGSVSNNDGARLEGFYNSGSPYFNIYTGGTERLRVTAAGNVSIRNDSGKFTAGTGDDLEIYHDGSHSYIRNGGTGNLYIDGDTDDLVLQAGDDIRLQVQGNENAIRCEGNGPVELYYDASLKLSTTSGGINVTGSVTATSFSGSGANLTGLPAGFSELDAALFN